MNEKRPIIHADTTGRLPMTGRWIYDAYNRPERDRKLESHLLSALTIEIQSADSYPQTEGDAIDNIKRILVNNYSSVQSLSNLANLSGLSTRQMSRLFRQRFDCSIMTYLRQVRTEAALNMINRESFALEDIAKSCGFTSANYLIRVIREATGQTPGQIRAKTKHGTSLQTQKK